MQLYGSYLSPFTCRVLIQIAAKNLDIELVDPPDGLNSASYRALNPIGKIPALDTGDTVIPESAVICDYLEAVFPSHPMGGRDPAERATIHLIARIFDVYVMNAMLPIFGQMDPATRDQTVADAATQACLRGLGFAEAWLPGSAYAYGNRLTLADCMAAPTLLFVETFLPAFGVTAPFAQSPSVAAYWADVQGSEPVAAVLDKMKIAIGAA